MIQTYPFPAGGIIIRAAGTTFRYVSSATAGVDDTIRVRADGNDLGTYSPGDQIELPVVVSTWEVVPLSATAAGVCRVGMGRVTSDRLQGVVSVVDGERGKVSAGVCFSASVDVAGATFGPRAQIYNASANRVIFVTAVTLGAAAADTWGLSTTTTALTTLSASQPVNHDSAAAGSVAAQVRQDAAGQGLAALKLFRAGYLAPSVDRVVVLPKPLMLRPGVGAFVFCNSAANTLRASFEFEEWPA